MKAHYLGHAVFYVKDLKAPFAFYRDLLGFQEAGRIFNGGAAALTSGRTHHELLLIEVGDAPAPAAGRPLGLYHIGIKVGDSLPGIFAAGDARCGSVKRVASAVGEGSMAVQFVHQHLAAN